MKKVIIGLGIVGIIVSGVFLFMREQQTDKTITPTGEWKYELFSDSEIQQFARPQHREVFWIIWRWKNAGYKSVLDVGAGLGADSILFAENGFNVSAIDINEFSMDRLANIAKEQHLSIDAIVADAKQLPYKDNTFDAVFANQVVGLSGCENAKKIMNELCRVLKSEGSFYFNINYSDDKEWENSQSQKRGSQLLSDDKLNSEYCDVGSEMFTELLKPLNVLFAYKETTLLADFTSGGGWYHVVASCKK
jgi:ubiquinone/menaquinone biosynthesis C-methylase UbiE